MDSIYGAVGHPGAWAGVLQTIIGVTGACSGCLLVTCAQDSRGNVRLFHEIDPSWISQYNDQFYRYDVSPALIKDNPGRVIVDAITGPRLADLAGENRLFYNEVMRPQKFRHTLHAGLLNVGQRSVGIILQRPACPGSFESSQITALQNLTPHLHRALHLHASLQSVDDVTSGLSALLDRVPMGAVLLNATGDVVHANTRAEKVLGTGSVLSVEGGQLKALETRGNQLLQRLIAAGLTRKGEINDMTLQLRGRSTPDLYLQITPMDTREPRDPLLPASVRAAVWIGTCEPSHISPSSLAKLYNLSPTEATLLALLVEGKSSSEITDLRNVSINTVRTQIKTIMNKLGASRQADLVRIVMSGPGGTYSK